jgi:NAD(P)-dependent dehydrogenase (short-subunit alcohol dehydrogenase family)
MRTAVVTGANRGIGLALTRVYLARGWRVIATCRDMSSTDALEVAGEGADLEIETLDVTREESIGRFVERLKGRRVDMLVNNAGVYRRTSSLDPFDRIAWEETMETNVIGPMQLTATMLPCLRAAASRRIISMSSALGSTTRTDGGSHSYRASKAALNMSMRTLARELEAEGFTVLMISPGVVDTRLARDVPQPKISAEESAQAMAGIIEASTAADNGKFLRHTGEVLPW